MIRDTSTTVWIITLCWACTLAVWSVVPRIFEAPDEPQHIDAVLDASSMPQLRWLGPRDDSMGRVTLNALEAYGYLAPEGDGDAAVRTRAGGGRTVADAIPRDERPTVADLGQSPRTWDRFNQMAQHPPAFYRLTGMLLEALPGWDDRMGFDVLVGLMRLVSVLFLTPLPVLVTATARELGMPPSAQRAAALSPFLVPQLAHIGSVVSNDPPLILFSALLAVILARVSRGDLTSQTARWAGVALLLSLLSKGLALLLPVGVVLAYAAGARASVTGVRPAFLQLLRAGAISALSLWWYGENLLRYGSLQPSPGAPPVQPVRGPAGEWWAIATELQVVTFWSAIGWSEVRAPLAVATTASVIVVLLVMRGAWRRPVLQTAALLLPGLLVVAWTWWGSWTWWGPDTGIRGIQGRYVFISITGILVLAVHGLDRSLNRFARWTWVPVAGAGLAWHAWVIRRCLQTFWMNDGSQTLVDDGVRSLLAWSPWPAEAVIAAAALGTVLAVESVRRLLSESLQGQVSGAPGGSPDVTADAEPPPTGEGSRDEEMVSVTAGAEAGPLASGLRDTAAAHRPHQADDHESADEDHIAP